VRPRWFNVVTLVSIGLLLFVALPGSGGFHELGRYSVRTIFGELELSKENFQTWEILMLGLMAFGIVIPLIWLALWVIEQFRSY
jgi:hypothetical protein